MSYLYLGVDAGNSKTVALVSDAEGTILGWGRSGVGDIYGIPGESAARREVIAAVDAAVTMAGVDTGALAGAAFRLAGVDWDEDRTLWEVELELHLPSALHRTVKNDGFALLRIGDVSGLGIAVTAGTGPAVAGRGPAGEFAGSWWIQEYLGGAAMGESALRAVMRSHLGLEPPTAMTGPLLALEGARDEEELLWLYTRRSQPRRFHDLKHAARLVLSGAQQGDPAACAIVTWQAQRFAQYVGVTAGRCGFDPHSRVPVVLGGSLLTSEIPVFRQALAAEIEQVIPGAHIVSVGGSPAAGALLDALAEGGAPVTETLRDRVLHAPIPADLFQT